MPEICRFFGISILMYFNDHNPPHFHVIYGNYSAIIDIKNAKLTQGNLPPKKLELVLQWTILNKEDLLRNWKTIKKDGKFKKIQPLKRDD